MTVSGTSRESGPDPSVEVQNEEMAETVADVVDSPPAAVISSRPRQEDDFNPFKLTRAPSPDQHQVQSCVYVAQLSKRHVNDVILIEIDKFVRMVHSSISLQL